MKTRNVATFLILVMTGLVALTHAQYKNVFESRAIPAWKRILTMNGLSASCICKKNFIQNDTYTALSISYNEQGLFECIFSNDTSLPTTGLIPLNYSFTWIKSDHRIEEVPIACDPPYERVRGVGCLKLVEQTMNFDDARSYCQRINGDLYVATDAAEFTLFREHLLISKPAGDIWVGVRGQRWLDGRPLTDEWCQVITQAPNGDITECARVRPSCDDYLLDDKVCQETYWFMCEQ